MDREKKKPKDADTPHPLTRREFTLGSAALLGAYAFAEDPPVAPLSKEAAAVKLEISDTIRSYMEVRHILEDDVRRVIDHAERTGRKLYQTESDRFLSKLRVKDVYFYAEYSPCAGGYNVHGAYTHRFLMEEDEP